MDRWKYPRYCDQQLSGRPRDQLSPEIWDQQPIDRRDPSPLEYWNEQQNNRWNRWPSESFNQLSTYPRDRWLPKPWDQSPFSHWNTWPQEYYQQPLETIRRPLRVQRSSVSHEPLLPTPYPCNQNHVNYRNVSCSRIDQRKHPYRCNDKKYQRNVPVAFSRRKSSAGSSHKHSTNVSDGNQGSPKKVSINSSITVPASNKTSSTTSNTGSERALLAQIENNDATTEDVHYLYSVNNNERMLVELIDLSENSQISENQNLLALESNNSYIPVNSNYEACDSTALKESTCDNSTKTLMNKEKEKSDTQNTYKIEAACGDTYCIMCNKSYEELHNNKCDLYNARCGHLFCVLCIKQLQIKSKCVKCGNTVSNLRKISL